jgi:group I intron endonuclease
MKPIDFFPSKENTTNIGIYMLYCVSSEKAYIGRSKAIKRRFYSHFYYLEKNKHPNQHLQNSYNKYGKEAIIKIILENCDKKDLAKREEYYCSLIDKDSLLNLMAVGSLFPISIETRTKISQALKGREKKFTEEHKKNLSRARKGLKLPAKTKEQLERRISEGIRKRGKDKQVSISLDNIIKLKTELKTIERKKGFRKILAAKYNVSIRFLKHLIAGDNWKDIIV